MSTAGDNNEVGSSGKQETLSCSMTFQNAIEIDFGKLREMAKQEKEEEEKMKEKLGNRINREEDGDEDKDREKDEEGTESQSAPVLQSSIAKVGRDLSIYDRPLDSHDPDSSDDENECRVRAEGEGERDEEAETEVENSNSDDDEGESMPYEQLGSTEFTKASSDDEGDGANSDGEFGEFESCPVSYQMMSEDNDSDQNNPNINQQDEEEVMEDTTQDVLGSYLPRTPATAIPPLDQDKIDLIKKTMAGLKLKPLGNAGKST
jgi:hypothetical protein